MNNESLLLQRRTLLKAMGGMAFGAGLMDLPLATAAEGPTPGKPGDFDFLAGKWKINHRKLKTAGGAEWDEFKGEATCWTVLDGVGSIEELRIPERKFSGMGIRLLDLDKHLWSDYWVSGKSGVLGAAGLTGGFEIMSGTFTADDVDGDRPIKVRGVWDRITPTSCRWRQGASRDGGKTWQEDWFMDWVRA